jgi:hypothetical protein
MPISQGNVGLYRYLVSSGVEPAQAQDVTQEAFLRLYAALRDGASIHSLKGWVYRVAHNLAVDSLLRDRRHRAISNAVASALATLENTERDLIERDWLENVNRAVGQLSRQQLRRTAGAKHAVLRNCRRTEDPHLHGRRVFTASNETVEAIEHMFAIEHLSDKTLSSLWSEDLPAAATESILAHLESCVECGQRLEAMDSSIEQYRHFVRFVDSYLPAPPRVWADIRSEMERVDRSVRPVTMQPAKTHQGRPVWIGAIAAAILLAFLVWRAVAQWHARDILTRARSADRAHSRKRSQLRVVTRQASFERPALLAGDAAGNHLLRAQFQTARYDWNEPLSAAAFRGWRDQLRQKTDRLSESREPAQYRLETTTAENVVRNASIVFEGPELTPVSLRLVFDGGGWVEITALPEAPATVLALRDHAPPKTPVIAQPRLTDRQLAGRELDVRLAIDALSNDTPDRQVWRRAREHRAPPLVAGTGAPVERGLSGKKEWLLSPCNVFGPRRHPKVDENRPSALRNGASLTHLLATLGTFLPPVRHCWSPPAVRP